MIYIGDDVSKDEAIKVAENLVIEGNTTMVKTPDCLHGAER